MPPNQKKVNRAESYEEVNAWGNYDQTAKNTRSWKPGRHGKKPRSQSYAVTEEFSLSALEAADGRIIPQYGTSPSLGGLARRRHTQVPSSSSDWNLYLHHSSEKSEKHIQTIGEGHDEEEDTNKDSSYEKEPQVKDLLAKDSVISNDIRDLFGVYFEQNSSVARKDEMTTISKPLYRTSRLDAITATMPWLRGYIKRKVGNRYLCNIFLFTDLCLRGIGQVYFQNNPVSGLLILIGMYLQSTRVATHGIIALVSGNLAALLVGFDQSLVNGGLFGYNAFLVGLALATFYSGEEHSGYYWPVILGTVFFSSFTSILFVMMGKILVPYKSPPLTLPFNVATMMFLVAVANMSRVDMDPVRTPSLPNYSGIAGDDTNISIKEFFCGAVRGIGQVYLADNLDSGLFVLAGIAVCSRVAALAAFGGSALGALTALAMGVPADAIEYGFYGFNCSLSVTAMFMFYAPSWGTAAFGVLSGIMTVFGQQALAVILEPYGLPFMTLPFCVVALPFIIIQGTTNLVIAIPLASMTFPEDHLRRVNILTDGFLILKDALNPEIDVDIDRFGKKTRRSISQLSRSISKRNTETDEDNIIKHTSPWLHLMGGRKTSSKDIWVRAAAIKVFDEIDVEHKGEIVVSQFEAALRSASLKSSSGLRFACKIFCLMDLDDSETVDKSEFVSFAFASWALYRVRRRIAKFFHFVDIDGNGFVDFQELDDARAYLGQPDMTDEEHNALTKLTGEYDEFEVDGLINFCTVAMVKIFVAAYHDATEASTSVDVSRHRISTVLGSA
mmetsp:Transcript_19288/g.29707  ORF Transcript_19288/g.29707 Transcript_19288/m.29707 type:complete len:783 (-) Transcript_19288:203-2551(-)